jgi:hypothetical protein
VAQEKMWTPTDSRPCTRLEGDPEFGIGSVAYWLDGDTLENGPARLSRIMRSKFRALVSKQGVVP